MFRRTTMGSAGKSQLKPTTALGPDIKNLKSTNVIVLGLTQNGKSSFIESVLDYSGSEPLAPNRPATGRGTHSETKDVSTYPVFVNIKRFFTKKGGKRVDVTYDSTGSVVTMTYDENDRLIKRESESLEWISRIHPTTKKRRNVVQNMKVSPWERLDGLEPQEPLDSGCQLRLNMIDTPGLSDSSGIQKQIEEYRRRGMSVVEAKKAAYQASRNLVDEAHRLKIIKAISDTSVIHGVCLVIQRVKVFGEELAQLKLFVDMFRSTGVKVNYYIIHTKFSQTTMFQAAGLSRIREAEEFFGIQAKHYFVNNKPDRSGDEPLSAYFADRVLSNFFFDIHEAPGVQMRDIKFRKTDTSIDEDLASTLKKYIISLTDEDQEVQEAVKVLDTNIIISESKIESYEKEVRKWKSERTKLDVYDHVLVAERTSWVDYGFWEPWPTCEFDVETNVTIRKVDTSDAENRGQWNPQSSNYGVGTKRCQVRFDSNFREKAGGTIKIYGWKKDVKADEIKTLDDDCDRVNRLLLSERGVLSENTRKRDAFHAQRKEINDRIESLKATISDSISLDYIPLSKLSESGHFLLTNDVYCVAEGYKLTTRIPKTLLYDFEFNEQDVNLELNAQDRKHQQMEALCATVTTFLKRDFVQKKKLLDRLKAVNEKLTAQRAALNKMGPKSLPDELKAFQSTSFDNLANLGIESDLMPYLQKTYIQLRERQNSITTSMRKRSDDLEGVWTTALEEISPIINRLEESVSEARSGLQEWHLKRSLHSFSQAAIDAVSKLYLNAPDYSVGAFTVLKRAIEKRWHDAKAPHPFVQLYRSIAYKDLVQLTASSAMTEDDLGATEDV
ncbi:hypothetical protein Dda_9313 [Drechslerella dactyloides]|uniref:G domain-containing protein n=1 Tax=Drechslerella dactyloides TaxID=74499 RepID=A0AAD6IPE0_DREDA|nr:hypothetical protein Dda_9313 [Drechslerella dactyloides]